MQAKDGRPIGYGAPIVQRSQGCEAREELYRQEYQASWASVVGINEHRLAGPLEWARNDAEAIAKILAERSDFPESNVRCLFDREATNRSMWQRNRIRNGESAG